MRSRSKSVSLNLAQVKADQGKAGAWQVVFVSPSRGKAKTYTYSAVEAEGNLHEGVFGGIEEDYTRARGFLPLPDRGHQGGFR